MSETMVSGRPPQQPKYPSPVTGPLTDAELRATPVNGNVAQVNGQTVNVGIGVSGNGTQRVALALLDGTYAYAEDTSFVTGDSPVTIDLNGTLGKNASNVTVINDGAGNFTVALSADGVTFGTAMTVKYPERLEITGTSVDSVKITWVSNSAYRVFAE